MVVCDCYGVLYCVECGFVDLLFGVWLGWIGLQLLEEISLQGYCDVCLVIDLWQVGDFYLFIVW